MTSEDDLVPVWVSVRSSDGIVSVMMLVDTHVGVAIYEGDTYKDIGQVREERWTEFNERLGVTTTKRGWRWNYDEIEWGRHTGRTRTKGAAIAAILAAGGYRQVPAEAPNPGLF